MRSARKISKNGVYHVIFRGNNKSDVFYDDDDRIKLLYVFKDLQKTAEFQIYAYCLMTNHVHMLIRCTDDLGGIMRRALDRYVLWYNRKYERIGNLFQDRFFSKPVETRQYFVATLQYIFMNPVQGGLVRNAIDYKWSNLRDWFGQQRGMPELCVKYEDLPIKPSLFDTDMESKGFEIPVRVFDSDVRALVMELLELEAWRDVQNVNELALRKCVNELLERGTPVASVARILGMTRYSVKKILTEMKG